LRKSGEKLLSRRNENLEGGGSGEGKKVLEKNRSALRLFVKGYIERRKGGGSTSRAPSCLYRERDCGEKCLEWVKKGDFGCQTPFSGQLWGARPAKKSQDVLQRTSNERKTTGTLQSVECMNPGT